MTCSTASRKGFGPFKGLKAARFSHASSMIFCALASMFLECPRKAHHAARSLDAFPDGRHQGHADMPIAGVAAGHLAPQKASGKHEHIMFMVEAAGKLPVIDGRRHPQIERSVWHLRLE